MNIFFYIKKNIAQKINFDFIDVSKEIYPIITDTKKYIKSPMNYIGGKYKLLPQILPHFLIILVHLLIYFQVVVMYL